MFPVKSKNVYQSAVVFGASFFHLSGMLCLAWASPSLPKLIAPGGSIPITGSQFTWILSSMKLGMIISPIPTAWMMERFGRKRTLLFGAVPLLGGWIVLAFAETYELMFVFAFQVGFALSVSEVLLPIYIAEISTAHIRGYLGTLFTVMGKIGLLLMYAIGPFISVRVTACLCTLPVCLFLVNNFWIPESPYHLLAKNRDAVAERNLKKLRCCHDVKGELAQMKQILKESQENLGTFQELFFRPQNRRNIVVVLGLSALLELSGSQIVFQYAQTIFATIDTDLDTKYLSIIFGVVQLTAAVLACFLVDTMGRRPLLLLSIIASGLCTMVIAVYYFLKIRCDLNGFGWIPLSAIMLFMITYSIGILPLMFVITSELFPKHLRGVAGATLVINCNVFSLMMIYAYQYGMKVWGIDYVFMAFSLLTFAFVPFVLALVSETKRKTLENILKG